MRSNHRTRKTSKSGSQGVAARQLDQGQVVPESEGEQNATTFMLLWIGLPLLFLLGLVIVHTH